MRKFGLKKNSETGEVAMSVENLKICARNQQGYENLYLNDSLQLQYCNFTKIQNLQQCICSQNLVQSSENQVTQSLIKQTKGVNTLFLNNNIIEKIQNLETLSRTLVTLNLANNRISHFSGLKQLLNLVVLDLSHNKIRLIQKSQIQPLVNLKRLNLSSNLFTDQVSIQGVVQLRNNLETLELGSNESFQPQVCVLREVFGQMSQLKILVLKQTPFVRSTSAYRKKVILAVQSLSYLDDRPVTQDQRYLAKAWQHGGLREQQQARKAIRQKQQQKNANIWRQMQQQNKIISIKVEKIFKIKAKQQIRQLELIKQQLAKSSQNELLTSEQQRILQVRIQQLERYLQLLREQCKGLDLDKELGIKKQEELPKMLIQKRTNQCVFVYNITPEQLQIIKHKYYPEETLPIIPVNYSKPQEIYWLTDYNPILTRLYRILKRNWHLILPSFNLDVYEFDLNAKRKLRRFHLDELMQKFHLITQQTSNDDKQTELHYVPANQLATPNPLDCLD